jgi:hypothetical protein
MRALLVMGLALAAPFGGAQADQVLGTWCWGISDAEDEQNSATVVTRSDAGEYVMVQKSYEGQDLEFPLMSVGVNEYAVKGSSSGDGLIIRADGMLELYDSQGSLGAAAPRDLDECLKGNPQ